MSRSPGDDGPRADGEPDDDRQVDVVQYSDGAVKAVPAGKGAGIARSQRRRRPASVLGDRVVLAVGGLATAGAVVLSLLVLVYALLIARALLLGLLIVVVLVVGAGLLVAAAAGVRWLQQGDASLLEEAVPLRDAREQWDAEPVSAVLEGADPAGSDDGAADGREGDADHATEGETG